MQTSQEIEEVKVPEVAQEVFNLDELMEINGIKSN